jgi:hypothetical protein
LLNADFSICRTVTKQFAATSPPPLATALGVTLIKAYPTAIVSAGFDERKPILFRVKNKRKLKPFNMIIVGMTACWKTHCLLTMLEEEY